MINDKTFLKIPIPFKDNLYVYPPSVKEALSFENFDYAVQLLTVSQEDLEDQLTDYGKKVYDGQIPTPWEYLWVNAIQNIRARIIIESCISFFLKQPAIFLVKHMKIFIGDLSKMGEQQLKVESLPFIEEKDYFDFQNLIRESIGLNKAIQPKNEKVNPKIARMRALARYRDKVKSTSKNGIKFSTTLISLCCMGIGITPLNVGEISYASVSPLFEMCQNKAQYETEVRSLQAGADPKKLKPKYWIKNFDDD